MSLEAIGLILIAAVIGWAIGKATRDSKLEKRAKAAEAERDEARCDRAATAIKLYDARTGRRKAAAASLKHAVAAEKAEQRVADFIAWVDDLDTRALPPVPQPTSDQTIPSRPWNGTPIALTLPRYEAPRRSRAVGK